MTLKECIDRIFDEFDGQYYENKVDIADDFVSIACKNCSDRSECELTIKECDRSNNGSISEEVLTEFLNQQ